MQPQRGQATVVGLGPITKSLPTPTGTAPLTESGILNGVVGTTTTKVYGGTGKGNTARCRLQCFTASVAIAFTMVDRGSTAPTITATGADTDGILMLTGTGPEWFSIPDTMDLYIVAAAAATEYQLVVVVQ